MGDSFAVAVIHWPAVVGFMEVGNQGWELAVRIALGVWIVVLALAMIAGRGKAGAQWGLAMTMCAGLVAAFWAAHPGAWMYLFLGLLFLFFHVALRARLQEAVAGNRRTRTPVALNGRGRPPCSSRRRRAPTRDPGGTEITNPRPTDGGAHKIAPVIGRQSIQDVAIAAPTRRPACPPAWLCG